MNMHVTQNAEATISQTSAKAPDAMSIAISLLKAHMEVNKVETAQLPGLVREIYMAVSGSMAGQAAVEKFPGISKTPIIPVSKSVHKDGIVCLIDGRKMLMLKRHLRSRYGMTWEDYLEHFNLPKDYPSVAPEYSAMKRTVAKMQGLGSTIDKTPRALREAQEKRGRGRPRKMAVAA